MYKAPRGTSDILPQDQPYFSYIEQKAIDLCRLYGYLPIETPVFEDAGLFKRSVGEETDIVDKEMYVFEDKGGSELALRPEGTAPVCRAYIEHGMQNLPQPVKLYYTASLFRYERPQAGRFRQHHQFGAEAIGDGDAAVDAELIDMVWNLITGLGIGDVVLYINSIGCPKCRTEYLDQLKKYYGGQTDVMCSDCKTRLVKNPLRLLDCKKDSCTPLVAQAPKSTEYLCAECADHYGSLKRYLQLLKVPYTENAMLVRGLDYYTKTVFEIQPKEEKGAQVTIAGGGRFDGLIEMLGGKPTPAIGFAAGIERIMINLKKQGVPVPEAAGPSVFVAHVGSQAKDKALTITSVLRENGIAAVQSLSDRSLKAQLRQASGMNVSYTIIVGEEEIKSNTITVKDMSLGSQQIVSSGDLTSMLSAIGGAR